MKKLIFIVLCIFFYASGNALSVEISWMHVQHREYGAGKDVNRLGVGLIDDRGNYLSGNQNIKEVKLFDPNKKEVKMSKVNFDSVEEIFGTYDAKNSQWFYSKTWQFDSWFNTEIMESLNPGIYWLKVTTTDGKVAERTYAFNKRIELPIIDSNSFQFDTDQSGNLFWRWNIPIELGHLSLSHKMRARSAIEIYKNNKTAGYLSIILPAHMGYIFIPRDVVQFMNQKGNQFEMKISLETRDKNNRTYSKPLIINKMLPVVSNPN